MSSFFRKRVHFILHINMYKSPLFCVVAENMFESLILLHEFLIFRSEIPDLEICYLFLIAQC